MDKNEKKLSNREKYERLLSEIKGILMKYIFLIFVKVYYLIKKLF